MKIINLPLITSILLIPWLAACNPVANDSDSQVILPPQPSETQNNTNNNSIALSQTCTNNNLGYQVSYPQDWHSNPGKVLDLCQVFDPQSATVPPNTESTDKAIYLRVEENIPFNTAAKENIGERHLSRQNLTIQGNRAVAVERESTGKALLAKGVNTYSYIIDLGEQTMIAITYDIPGNDYQKNKQILDRMMETLQFEGQTAQK